MRLRAVFVSIALVYASTNGAIGQEVGDSVIVISMTARLKAGKEDLGLVPLMTDLEITKVEGNWCWVEWEGKRGWINRNEVSSLEKAPEALQAVEARLMRNLAIATVYERLGNNERAIEYWSTFSTDNPTALQSRARCYLRLGQVDSAIADLSRLIDLKSTIATDYVVEAYVQRSACLSDLGDFQHSLEDVTAALELAPNNAFALGHRASLRLNQGDYADALSDADQSLEHNPDDLGVRLTLADAHYALHHLDDAIREYSRILESPGAFLNALENRGKVYALKGDFNAAIDDFTQAIEICATQGLPDRESSNRLLRSTAYMDAGHTDLALRDADAVVAARADDVSALIRRAELRLRLESYQHAADDYSKALEIDPLHVEALNSYAWLLATCADAGCRDGKKAVELAHGNRI